MTNDWRTKNGRQPTLLLLASSLLLMSCSGGGSGDNESAASPEESLPYTGVKQAANIDAGNAESIFDTFRIIAGPPGFSEVVDGEGITEDSSIISMADSFRELAQLRINNPTSVSQTIEKTDNCTGGGQLRVLAELEPKINDSRLSITFYNCTEDAITIDGKLRISTVGDFNLPPDVPAPLNALYEFIEFSINDGLEHLSYAGSVPCVYGSYPTGIPTAIIDFKIQSSQQNFLCQAVNLNIENSAGEIYRLEDTSFSKTAWRGSRRGVSSPDIIESHWRTYTFSGRFYHPEHGYVNVSDPSGDLPFAFTDYSYLLIPFPWMINIKMTGANSFMQTHFSEPPSVNPSQLFKLLVNGDSVETAEVAIPISF